MKPIDAYPSMSAAVRELGADGFVSAVLRSQRSSSGDRSEPPAWRVAPAWARPNRALAALRSEHDPRGART